MSEDNQENGTANGDVPEIELIIKDKIKSIDVSDTDSNRVLEPLLPILPVIPVDDSASTNDQYIIFQLKTDKTPMFNYVITQVKKPPLEDGNPSKTMINLPPFDAQNDHGKQLTTAPYVISVQIPAEPGEEEVKDNSVKSRRAARQKKLTEAVDAVVSKELSISKAANVFQVAKSTLWKEVNKHTNHRRKKVDLELNQAITDRICAGESLSVISRSLKVAKSTLHQHKVRLAQRGQLPSNVSYKPPRHPSERVAMQERIIQAFRGCHVNGMSLRLAAKFHKISPSTLSKYMRRFKASQLEADDVTDQVVINEAEGDSEEELLKEETASKEQEDLNDFDVDAYCKKREETNSEDSDFLTSFDFETFEEYVKRELE